MPQPAAKLRRERRLRDVTLFAIACIVGVRWVPAAAQAGPGSVLLWLLAAGLFVAPLAVAVAALSAKYPGAGFYLWTRNDFGPWHGFLCFWIYWIGVAFWFPSAAIFYMSAGIRALGPPYAAFSEDRTYLIAASLAGIWIALGTNLVGMKVGKWTENIGGVTSWAMAAVLAVLAWLVWMRRGSATPFSLIPAWNWQTASFWATIAYGMTGLEMAALMGEEIKSPERTLPRAGWIASGFATAFYAAATMALLVLVRPEKLDEVSGLARGGEAASAVLGWSWPAAAIAAMVFLIGVGQFGGLGSAVSRLPFAAGVDGLLPEPFARIHPRWGTPHVSILLLGCVASLLLIAMQIGDTLRAAYQALVSLMVIGGFLPYVYIFGSAWKAGKPLSALSGWLVTAVALIGSLIPTAGVQNVSVFETKLAAGTIAMIASAWLVYRRRRA